MNNNVRRPQQASTELPSGYFDVPVDYNSPPPYDQPPDYPRPLPSFFTLYPPEYILVQDDTNFVTQISQPPIQNSQPVTRKTGTGYFPLEEILSPQNCIIRRIKEIKDQMTAIKNVVEELENIPKHRHDQIDTNKINIALREISVLKNNHLATEQQKLADHELRLNQILKHKTEQDRLIKIFNRPQIREASGCAMRSIQREISFILFCFSIVLLLKIF
ncbi:23932_t:CDS:1 [Gigaspora margarita]|uniref:23932_t:CDS:1 n=1 Tax=Gigaspora margarita TaxID=4874 RepID=A0ABM8W0M4_GIGMA|nr:23932_t:CDS:1 [Gigaspora margarita]